MKLISMQGHSVELELQKQTMSADSLNALGLSAGNASCRSPKATSRPLKILFSYPTRELAKDALEFFNGFTVILRGQKITFSASHLACIDHSGENSANSLKYSILLTEERNVCASCSHVEQKHVSRANIRSRSPSTQLASTLRSKYQSEYLIPSQGVQPTVTLSANHVTKETAELNDATSKVSETNAMLTNRLSGLNLSAPLSTKSPDLTHPHVNNSVSIAESYCAPDTDTKYHIVISNIPTDTLSPDIVKICRSQGFFPLEEAPVIFEANLETNSNQVYMVQRSMTVSFSDLATAMLCKDFLNQYVIDQDSGVKLFAKLVDKLSEQKVHATGVLVRHIPRIVQQDVFFSAMSSFGGILSCRFVRGTRTTTGFGAVIFEASTAAIAAKKQGLTKIKEFTLQYIEAKRLTKTQQGSLIKSQSCRNEFQQLPDSVATDKPLKNSVSFGAVSYADPAAPQPLVMSLSNNSDDSTTDVIRAVVEANNRLILSRKKEPNVSHAESAHLNPQISKLDLLYTAIHNHHLPEEFFKKYDTLIRQAGADDRLLSFLHQNAILHRVVASHRVHSSVANPSLSEYPTCLDGDVTQVTDNTLRPEINCTNGIELDARELELDITSELTATTDS